MTNFVLKIIMALTLAVLIVLKVIGVADFSVSCLYIGGSMLFTFCLLTDDKPFVVECKCDCQKTD